MIFMCVHVYDTQYYMKCVNESVARKKNERDLSWKRTLSRRHSVHKNIKNQPLCIHIYMLHHFISLTHSRNSDLEFKILFKKNVPPKKKERKIKISISIVIVAVVAALYFLSSIFYFRVNLHVFQPNHLLPL